jgi:hypothetical protein
VLWDNKGTGQVLLKLTDSDAGYSDSVELNVEVMPQPPKPVITFDGTYLYSSNPNGNQWYFEGLAIKGATDAKLKPDKFGNYSVQVTGNNGCISGISEAFNVEPGYTASEDEFRSIILFPNPAENDIEICLNNFPDEMAKISLSNILGEIVVEDSVAPLTKKYISSINVNSLANGIYLVRVSIGNINFTKSVIIKK